jgi:hypothetical protein
MTQTEFFVARYIARPARSASGEHTFGSPAPACTSKHIKSAS